MDMSQLLASESARGTVELIDDFSDACGEGRVLGRKSASGHVRLGTDLERAMSIDNGALRIAPPVNAGFGQRGAVLWPVCPSPGLAFAVFLLNGHNTSQDEPLSDTFHHRLQLWLRGSETEAPWVRVLWWLRQARFRRALRQIQWWRRTACASRGMPCLNENLAIGWHANVVESDPRCSGSGFVMHALGPENGELWAGAANRHTRALRSVQNLPIYYIAITRAGGTVYYVSSLEDWVGFAAYPAMRPIAVDDCEMPGAALSRDPARRAGPDRIPARHARLWCTHWAASAAIPPGGRRSRGGCARLGRRLHESPAEGGLRWEQRVRQMPRQERREPSWLGSIRV